MTNEQKQIYTRRITESNPTGIIVILYEMFFDDTKEAKEALNIQDHKTAGEAIRHAEQVLIHLKNALNFKYEVSLQLFPLYDFCQRALARANYQGTVTGIEEAERIMEPLRNAFSEVAKQDTTAPVMQHTQRMVAGMTYGRTDITETTAGYDNNRGFLA